MDQASMLKGDQVVKLILPDKTDLTTASTDKLSYYDVSKLQEGPTDPAKNNGGGLKSKKILFLDLVSINMQVRVDVWYCYSTQQHEYVQKDSWITLVSGSDLTENFEEFRRQIECAGTDSFEQLRLRDLNEFD